MTTDTSDEFTFLKGDALAQLCVLNARSVHAVICDPPYNQVPMATMIARLVA
ncbi:MAG: hypothetical protein ACYDB2_05230 [Acidimicrobiales bacterium]